ncbi:MAG: hypothetical protein IJF52_06475 [Clostridia bacterium]|nr:hypothetical protein [Clostridia bacterium]
MKRKSACCVFAFASGLLVASLLPCEFVVVVAAITIIIICLIFRRRRV